MKNIKYFSFERNKYFYGKLLSVEDFETEQRYMNDKRRLINRFVNGCGVLCGMNVVVVDDVTISVERGIALDYAGREVVIDTPVTKKLSMIEGFEEYSDAESEGNDLYLCIRYDESQKEAVHSITTSQTKDIDDVEYNKYEEGYSLYLTDKEPEGKLTIADSYYKDSSIIYSGNGFSIKQEIPKYIKSRGESLIRITVEKTGQSRGIAFSYALESSCIKDVQGQAIIISFNEEDFEKSNRYVLTKKVRTMPVVDAHDQVKIVPGSFKLTIGKKKIGADVSFETVVNVTQKDIRRQIMDTYYKDIMNEVMQNSYEQHIYLAKLTIVKAGATYIIDSAKEMPFDQYIFNNMLTTIMAHMEYDYPQTLSKKEHAAHGGKEMTISENSEGQLVTTGEAVLDLGIGGSTGQRFFSGEISHGLGLGNVYITLGISYAEGEGNTLVYGSQDIFNEKDGMIRASLAAKVDTETGKFVIGLKCLAPTDVRQVRVNWMAVKDKQEVVMEKTRSTMHVRPDMFNIGTKETQYYEAILEGETESRVRWSIKEENGGTIDENGMYTAPNRQGVFEIIAESMDIPGMKASTFVVVRDKVSK